MLRGRRGLEDEDIGYLYCLGKDTKKWGEKEAETPESWGALGRKNIMKNVLLDGGQGRVTIL